MDKPWKIFDTRIRSANIARRNLPFTRVPDEQKQKIIGSAFNQRTLNPERVIYIHVPFCNNVCPFCIYHKQKIFDQNIISAYFSSVIKQITALSLTRWVSSAPFKAVYFGGGTPTSVPVEYLESIIGGLKKNYRLTADCEITVESTITDINPAMVLRLKSAGVNRISLGVQSFNSSVREKLGRRSSREQIAETIAFIRESGIENICIDLMYNLKDQNFDIWQNDLSFLSDHPITGCSVYPLISVANRANPNEPAELENLETEFRYFSEADSRLVEINEWNRLTPVQYGHRDLGNAVYVTAQGQNADLLAFGSGAGGRINAINYLQTGNIEEFINGAGDFINDSITFMSIPEDYLKYRRIFGLSESLSMNKSDYQSLQEYFDDIILKLIHIGLIESNDNTFDLTKTGRFWAANISALFAERIRNLINLT